MKKACIEPIFRNWLLEIIGCNLICVKALIHVHNNEENTSSPLELSLSFESASSGKLSCSIDGESLVWDNEELIADDIGEYGKTIVKDISFIPYWKNLIGLTLKDVKLVELSQDHCLMGLQFCFENDFFATVVNLGDELFMYELLPKEIVQEEHIKFSSIKPVRRNSREAYCARCL